MKVYLDSVGCRLNQSEIEQFGREFRSRGHQLTANPEEADLTILNTCAVTTKASSESRAKARHLSAIRHGRVVLTGCWSTIKPEAAASLPRVRAVIDNASKDRLVQEILPDNPIESERGMIGRYPLPGVRSRTRAFIKVQDGCDLQCSYCVTTVARGAGRSVPVEKVIDDIRYAERGGAKEAVLSGVHLGSWGRDLEPGRSLGYLIQTVLERTEITRIRLSSLEPWDLDADFFKLWQEPRLCRHLHLPLQSGSNRILRRMARRTTIEEFASLVTLARSSIPGVAITTDIIVGFPGEDQREFQESVEFVKSVHLAGGHVFTYSERPGTPAARLDEHVPHRIRKTRGRAMREVLLEMNNRFRQKHLGTIGSVLWEGISGSGPDGFELHGWTDNHIRATYVGPENLSNQITPVLLRESDVTQSSILVDLA